MLFVQQTLQGRNPESRTVGGLMVDVSKVYKNKQ